MRQKFYQFLRQRVVAIVCVTNSILSLLLCGDKNKYEISNVLESLGRQTETTCGHVQSFPGNCFLGPATLPVSVNF